ncbi:hypothetical protein niasHT_008406 [Heterodera trifolii]|uniref:Uncharacterized protein n=1 Tax=Heterodera trifolii TaxID=157864 RepID=A0ABD2LP65_9BILA
MRPFSICLLFLPLILLLLLPPPFANAFEDEEADNEMRAHRPWPSPLPWRPKTVTPRPGHLCRWIDPPRRRGNQRSGAILLSAGPQSLDDGPVEDGEDNEMRAILLPPCEPKEPYPSRPGGWPNDKPPQYRGLAERSNIQRSGAFVVPDIFPIHTISPPFFPTRMTPPWPHFPTRPPRPTRRPYVPDIVPQNVIPAMPSSN